MPFLTPGVLFDPGIKLMSLGSLEVVGRLFTTAPPGKSSGFLYLTTIWDIWFSLINNTCLMFRLPAAAAAKSLQLCPILCDPHRQQPTRLPHPWDSPGKNTGVGCHFLLQCMKVKSESEVAQSCPTLSDPMDCSLPGSSIHGIFQARLLEWGAIAFSVPKP